MKTITISKTYMVDKYMPDKNCILVAANLIYRDVLKQVMSNNDLINIFKIKIKEQR